MQYSKTAATLLALAATAISAPVSSGNSTTAPVASAASVAPATVTSSVPVEFLDNVIGVKLAGAHGKDALTFIMDDELIVAGKPSVVHVSAHTKYETLEVKVGSNFPDQEATLRCAITDSYGKRIFATRGANLDDTFSDAGNGEWTLEHPSVVSSIICDPAFVANNRNAQEPPAEDVFSEENPQADDVFSIAI